MLRSADFTPNRQRAIWVEGELNQKLLTRLEPQILALTSQSRAPITLFINSTGGTPAVGERILNLAQLCRIITVAAPKAHSAAADILSAGDHACAYPESTLLYHGSRIPMLEHVTGEWANLATEVLTAANERAAASLARQSARRFMFVVSAQRAAFSQHRVDANDSSLTDLKCFQAILRGKLSPSARKVLKKAITRWDSYDGLLTHFQKEIGRGRRTSEKADLQKSMLHASIACEYQSNERNPAWSLGNGGLSRIRDHFFFLDEYFRNADEDEIGKLCEWWAPVTDANVESTYFLPFRSFLVALCRALQEGENEVTGMDAFWLGLIDTVRTPA